MELRAIEHVQIAIPAGGEPKAREFFCGLLGMTEVPKPKTLPAQGAWFKRRDVKVHVSVDRDFRPASRSHIAFVIDDVPALREAAKGRGYTVEEGRSLDGFDRVFVRDPFGNRLEFMQPTNRNRS
jgi:catechol 2,3-dioxygenase-like lactoylglutathione lyase family enzyme